MMNCFGDLSLMSEHITLIICDDIITLTLGARLESVSRNIIMISSCRIDNTAEKYLLIWETISSPNGASGFEPL